MKAKGKIFRTKMETWVDLGVCLLLIPCLVSVFPVEEWILWRASDVIVYLMWTYLCWYLGRHAIPALAASGKWWTALAVVFIATVLTYLMSLKQVSFPRELIADRPPRLYMYQQAVWTRYICAMGAGLATGFLAIIVLLVEVLVVDESLQSAVESCHTEGELLAGTMVVSYLDVMVEARTDAQTNVGALIVHRIL